MGSKNKKESQRDFFNRFYLHMFLILQGIFFAFRFLGEKVDLFCSYDCPPDLLFNNLVLHQFAAIFALVLYGLFLVFVVFNFVSIFTLFKQSLVSSAFLALTEPMFVIILVNWSYLEIPYKIIQISFAIYLLHQKSSHNIN